MNIERDLLKQEHIRYGKARFSDREDVEPFVNRIYQDIEEFLQAKTSCDGCKYDDIEVAENERKAKCFPCLKPVTIRENYTIC